jgi:transcriptional regulator with XRE-family HTH domain
MENHIFATELRKHCSRFESISEVCRITQINRQQFGKYLSGKMLPNARSLRKICRALEVSEADLMSGASPTASPFSEDSGRFAQEFEQLGSMEMLALFASQRLNHLTGGNLNLGKGSIPAGHYFCYFQLHKSSPVLLRSLLSLRERAGVMYFSRRTYIPTTGNGGRYISRGKHLGIVVGTGSEVYLLGINRLAPHQVSFITLNSAPVMETRFSGLSLTRKGRDPIATNTFLHFIGRSTPRRELLKSIGMVLPLDPSLDPVISLLMEASRSAGQGQIHALHVDDLLRNRSYHSPEHGLQSTG